MGTVITKESALAAINEAIEGKGEQYIYFPPLIEVAPYKNACVYFHDGKPSCLIGHVFASHGYTPDDVMEFRGVGFQPCTVKFNDEFLAHSLGEAQRVQDGGGTWGEALYEFKLHAKL